VIKTEVRRYIFIALFTAALFFPFKGLKAAGIMFVSVLVLLSAVSLLKKINLTNAVKAARIPEIERFKTFFLPALLILSLVSPLILKDYYLDVLIISGIYILLALGLNVIVGFAGLLNLGFAAYYAIGAYAYAIANTKFGLGFWTSLPLSAMLAALAGLVVAIPALRLRGDYLAIVTLGFGEITRLVLNNWDSLTNGPNGITEIAPPSLFGFSLSRLQHYYYIVFLFVLLSVFIIRRVELSRIGRAWKAIRENEIAASAMGINTTKYKLYAFVLGTFWAGIAGILFAAKMRFVSPESFTFMESVLILSMVILGGIGNISGAVAGAFLLVMLPEVLRGAQDYRMLILGIGLALMMIFRPQGLLGNSYGRNK
jgi:branched-chain amino acid transport system permease protein